VLARVSIKPTTDPYSGVSGASLYGAELPLVHVPNPVAVTDPNTAALSPTDPLAVQWPNYAYFQGAFGVVTILGGTSLTGRFWFYEPALGKWFSNGSGSVTTVTVGALQGNLAAAMRASKPLYWQTTVVVGGVTDLFYGFG
jgi:hypothetical protein